MKPKDYSKDYPSQVDTNLFSDQTKALAGLQMFHQHKTGGHTGGGSEQSCGGKCKHSFEGQAEPTSWATKIMDPMQSQMSPEQRANAMNAIQMSLMSNIFEALNMLPTAQIEAMIQAKPEIVHTKGFNGMSPLHKAVLRDDHTIIDTFMKYEADVNARNDHQETPLHMACKKGNIVVIDKLIRYGADKNAVDKTGRGCMHHAAQGGSVLTFHYLKELQGLEFNLTDNNLITPLHLCCAHGQEEGLLYLLRNQRCDIYIRDIYGNTAMHIAAQYGQTLICWKLLELGGRQMIHDTNNQNFTPLQMAQAGILTKNRLVIDMLMVYGSQKEKTGKVEGPKTIWFGLMFMPALVFLLSTFISGLFTYGAYPMVVFCVLQVYTIRSHQHRMNHFSRWPNPIQAGMFAGGIFTTMTFYIHTVLPSVLETTPVTAMMTLFGCLGCAVLYYRMMTMDPGACTQSARKEVTGQSYSVRDIANGDIRLQALCTICEIIPPRRSRHCRLCEQCFMDCDHHCLFLYRCVARYNHRFFIFFVTYCVAAMLIYVYFTWHYCIGLYPAIAPSYAFLQAAHRHPGVAILVPINIASALWLLFLIGTQIKLISKGHTTAYQPNSGRTNLTKIQKLRNVMNFFLGKQPYALDSVVRVA